MQTEKMIVQIPKLYLWTFSFSILAVYIGSILFLSNNDQSTFNSVILFDSHVKDIFTFSFLGNSVIAFFSLLLLILPGFIWTISFKTEYKNPIYFTARIIAVSMLLLIGTSIVFKLFSPGAIDRFGLLIILSALIFSGLFFLDKKKNITITVNEVSRKGIIFKKLIIGLILILSIFLLFHGKFLNEDLNGDGLLAYRFASSLKTHVLSHGPFDMFEPSHVGFYISNPFFTDSYINMFFLNLFGETEGSIRLGYLIYLFSVYVIVCAFLPKTKNEMASTMMHITLGLLLFLYTIIMFFYTSNFPHFADLADVSSRQTLFLVFLLLEMYFLIYRDQFLFLVFAFFSALTLYSGPIFTALIFVAYYLTFRKSEERQFLKILIQRYALIGCCIIGAYVITGIFTGDITFWFVALYHEYIHEYLRNHDGKQNSFNDVFLYLKYYIVFVGGIPFLGFFIVRSKDKIGVLLSFVAIGYLLIVLGGSHKNMHYAAPIALLPAIILLRRSKENNKKLVVASVICSISIVTLINFSYPKIYRVHSDYKDFGQKTCVLLESYDEVKKMNSFFRAQELKACEKNKSSCSGEEIWEEDSVMMWLYYADVTKNPKREYDYYFTDQNVAPKENIKQYASNGEYYFWANTDIDRLIAAVPTEKDIFSNLFKGLIGRH